MSRLLSFVSSVTSHGVSVVCPRGPLGDRGKVLVSTVDFALFGDATCPGLDCEVDSHTTTNPVSQTEGGLSPQVKKR